MKKREAANLVNLARDPAQAIYGNVIAILDARKALASVSSSVANDFGNWLRDLTHLGVEYSDLLERLRQCGYEMMLAGLSPKGTRLSMWE